MMKFRENMASKYYGWKKALRWEKKMKMEIDIRGASSLPGVFPTSLRRYHKNEIKVSNDDWKGSVEMPSDRIDCRYQWSAENLCDMGQEV